IVFETDVARWLSLRGPGILYENLPYITLAPQRLEGCQAAEGNVPAHYIFPLQGGYFESGDPLEDMYDQRRSRVAGDNLPHELKLPKSTPASHIVSEHFVERILVDCKAVYKRGHIVVEIDHFTTYKRTMFVGRKFARPIANFMRSVMKDEDCIRRQRSKMDRDNEKPLATSLKAADSKVRCCSNMNGARPPISPQPHNRRAIVLLCTGKRLM
ncbi:hypothetical protein, partial [Hyphomonas sp.]|uniref:hypothetical protein n=1 Tax=Hyphomonas sp. TaxID=87 RepID=UPI0032999DA1